MLPGYSMGFLINTGVECMQERYSQNDSIIQCKNSPKFNSMYSSISKLEW